eukprot:2906804-Alexandrium_andersonii.AAC.1
MRAGPRPGSPSCCRRGPPWAKSAAPAAGKPPPPASARSRSRRSRGRRPEASRAPRTGEAQGRRSGRGLGKLRDARPQLPPHKANPCSQPASHGCPGCRMAPRS